MIPDKSSNLNIILLISNHHIYFSIICRLHMWFFSLTVYIEFREENIKQGKIFLMMPVWFNAKMCNCPRSYLRHCLDYHSHNDYSDYHCHFLIRVNYFRILQFKMTFIRVFCFVQKKYKYMLDNSLGITYPVRKPPHKCLARWI